MAKKTVFQSLTLINTSNKQLIYKHIYTKYTSMHNIVLKIT